MAEDRVTFLKCLADETRLSVVLLLATVDELCVCDLVDNLRVSQPLASRHLAQLRQCGVVRARRDGKWMHYRLSEELSPWQRGIIDTLGTVASDLPSRELRRRACVA